jgi:hypothetical protein
VRFRVQGAIPVAAHCDAADVKRGKCVVFMLRCQPFVQVKLEAELEIRVQRLCSTF